MSETDPRVPEEEKNLPDPSASGEIESPKGDDIPPSEKGPFADLSEISLLLGKMDDAIKVLDGERTKQLFENETGEKPLKKEAEELKAKLEEIKKSLEGTEVTQKTFEKSKAEFDELKPKHETLMNNIEQLNPNKPKTSTGEPEKTPEEKLKEYSKNGVESLKNGAIAFAACLAIGMLASLIPFLGMVSAIAFVAAGVFLIKGGIEGGCWAYTKWKMEHPENQTASKEAPKSMEIERLMPESNILNGDVVESVSEEDKKDSKREVRTKDSLESSPKPKDKMLKKSDSELSKQNKEKKHRQKNK